MSAREDSPPNRPKQLGRYELITRIGSGGMAEVQLAIQRGPAGFEKLVVVKLVHENLASQKSFVDMLLDEARIAALVKHPNVVDIYDLGEVDGRYYIAMEYLEGEPLLSILRAGREGPRLDVMSTARMIADTAEGLDAAHELRSLAGEALELVHHDVSLGNIVVLYNGQVKLVDFGVAKATQSTSTRNKVQGKFSYMAPEKMRGESGDRRSDIFSLGCVLWEALTLKRLFRGGNDGETMKQVLESVIVPPSQINADVPDELDPIVMRALEREPEYRYATAAELASDLEDVLRQHAYPRRNDAIAKYMQETFKDHIAARKKLLQEVASQGTASSEVLDLAFREPAPVPGAPDVSDFSVKFRRPASQSMEFQLSRAASPTPEVASELTLSPPGSGPTTSATPPPTTILSRTMSRRESTPVPGTPIVAAPIEPTVDADGNPRRVTDLLARLEHAGAQPLIETDLAHGISGQIPVVAPPAEDDPIPLPVPRAASSARREAVTPEPEPEPPRSRLGLVLIAIALLAAAAFVALHFLGGKGGEADDDDAPVRARKPVVVPAAPLDAAAAAVAPPLPNAPQLSVPDAAVAVVEPPPPAAPDAGLAPVVAEPDPTLPAGDDTAEGQYRIGARLADHNELGRALVAFKQAQKLDPAFAPTWRALGQLHLKLKDGPAAKAAFQKYLQLAPNAADAPQIRSTLETL